MVVEIKTRPRICPGLKLHAQEASSEQGRGTRSSKAEAGFSRVFGVFSVEAG